MNGTALIVFISILTFFVIWIIQRQVKKNRAKIFQQKTDAEIHEFGKDFWAKAHERKLLYYKNGGLNIENKTVFDFTQDHELLKRLIAYAFKNRHPFENPDDKSSEMSIKDFYEWNIKGTRWGQLNMLRSLAEITDNKNLKDAVIFEHNLFDEYCVEMMNRFGIIVN